MKIILLAALVVVAFAPESMADVFNDGGYYIIDNDDYAEDVIFLDIETFNDPGTHLDLNNGGEVSELEAWKISTINMTGGLVDYSLAALDNSVISVSGGSVGHHIGVYDNATITMSGGSVGTYLKASHDGTFYLEGTNFAINGTALAYGSKLSDFVSSTDIINGYDFYTGTITGTLTDGSALNNEFRIYNNGIDYNADIIIIPEPCTLVLLSLGGLVLRRCKA